MLDLYICTLILVHNKNFIKKWNHLGKGNQVIGQSFVAYHATNQTFNRC